MKTQRGFSLVELMVGLVIGLLATLVILQMFALFEGQKRTTTSGSDAQENGLVALLTMERDIRMAGVGLANSSILSCATLQTYYNSNATGSTGGSVFSSFAPIQITDGGAGSDQISLLFGDSLRAGVAATITNTMPNPSADLDVSSTAGFNQGDLVIVSDGSTCRLVQISQVQAAAFKIQHNFSSSGPSYNCNANCMANTMIPAWTNSFPSGSNVFDMGSITQRSYQVATSTSPPTSVLQVTDLNAAATPIVSDIVNIQAQYGIANSGSQQVNCWVNATNGGNACDAGNWAAPSGANIQRIKAVHIAVVARSSLSEKPSSGTICDATTTAPTSWSGGPTINLSSDPNWQCYRYKVYQTIVPLRNIIWANL
jgi:type IV pilus assembly protein PilW